jgi:LmbE family N-acetylglucosaminyl deacetylase
MQMDAPADLDYSESMETSEQHTILAVGAHYDDCIFGVPGILLKAIKKGHRVVILSIIGDYTNWAPVGAERQNVLIQGTRRLCEERGVEIRFLDYKSMHFEVTPETKRAVCEEVAAIAPHIGLLLWPRDTHPDHEVASTLSNIAFRWSSAVLGKPASRPNRLFYYDNGPAHTVGFEPDTFVDISEESLEAFTWLGNLMALVRGEDSTAVEGAIESKERLAGYRGRTCGVKFCEALKSFNRYPIDIL